MKRIPYAMVLAILLLAARPAASLAATTPPPGAIGACPTGFDYMDASMLGMDGMGDHIHAGIQVDLNGDGWVCMQQVTPTGGVHVHVDDYLPLP